MAQCKTITLNTSQSRLYYLPVADTCTDIHPIRMQTFRSIIPLTHGMTWETTLMAVSSNFTFSRNTTAT
jgi:hypothetical protein